MDALLRLTAVTTHHDVKELQWLCDAIGANVKGFMVQPKPDQLDRLLGLMPHPRHMQLSFISREKLTTMQV